MLGSFSRDIAGDFFPSFLDLSYSYSAIAKCPIQPIRKVVRVSDRTSEK